jgi:hypothetical protein
MRRSVLRTSTSSFKVLIPSFSKLVLSFHAKLKCWRVLFKRWTESSTKCYMTHNIKLSKSKNKYFSNNKRRHPLPLWLRLTNNCKIARCGAKAWYMRWNTKSLWNRSRLLIWSNKSMLHLINYFFHYYSRVAEGKIQLLMKIEILNLKKQRHKTIKVSLSLNLLLL